jgi:TPR repeat protein
MAHRLREGRGMNEDFSRALTLYRLAAVQNQIEAALWAGLCQVHGWGTPIDPAEGAVWIELAAENGHAEAARYLAGMYLDGEGVPQDDGRAFHWLTRAIALGDAVAHVTLGGLYAHGRGCERDLVRAYLHTSLGLEAWPSEAERNLAALELRLTEDDLEEARRRVLTARMVEILNARIARDPQT